MDKIRNEKYLQIIKRAEREGIFTGTRISALMDIENADETFELCLDDWLNADIFDFTHDFLGILDNILREISAILFLGFQKRGRKGAVITNYYKYIQFRGNRN